MTVIAELLLSTQEASLELGYSLQHTRLLIRQKKLQARKIGRDWVIERSVLKNFVETYKKKSELD